MGGGNFESLIGQVRKGAVKKSSTMKTFHKTAPSFKSKQVRHNAMGFLERQKKMYSQRQKAEKKVIPRPRAISNRDKLKIRPSSNPFARPINKKIDIKDLITKTYNKNFVDKKNSEVIKGFLRDRDLQREQQKLKFSEKLRGDMSPPTFAASESTPKEEGWPTFKKTRSK